MNLIVYGSRSLFPHHTTITRVVYDRWGVLPDFVVCGMARGADLAGRAWALRLGIGVIEMPANWEKWGRRAGYLRNVEMAEVGHAGLGFWDGKSAGTAHMTNILKQKGKSHHVEVLR